MRRNIEVVNMILNAVVANPLVLRRMPAVLARHGLKLTHFLPEVFAEARNGSFFLKPPKFFFQRLDQIFSRRVLIPLCR